MAASVFGPRWSQPTVRFLLLVCALGAPVHGIFDSRLSAARPDKYKQRVDLKPIDIHGYESSSTPRPPVLVYSGRQRPRGHGLASTPDVEEGRSAPARDQGRSPDGHVIVTGYSRVSGTLGGGRRPPPHAPLGSDGGTPSAGTVEGSSGFQSPTGGTGGVRTEGLLGFQGGATLGSGRGLEETDGFSYGSDNPYYPRSEMSSSDTSYETDREKPSFSIRQNIDNFEDVSSSTHTNSDIYHSGANQDRVPRGRGLNQSGSNRHEVSADTNPNADDSRRQNTTPSRRGKQDNENYGTSYSNMWSRNTGQYGPNIPSGRPSDSGIGPERPIDPNIASGRPSDPNIPSGRPSDSGIGSGRPINPNTASGRPSDPNIASRRPIDPGTGLGRPTNFNIGSGRPSSSSSSGARNTNTGRGLSDTGSPPSSNWGGIGEGSRTQLGSPPEPALLRCPAQHGMFPHPTDCSQFIQCAHGRLSVQRCGPGTVFNPVYSTCDWPANVDCPPPEETPAPTRPTAGEGGYRELEFPAEGRNPATPPPSLIDRLFNRASHARSSAFNRIKDSASSVVGSLNNVIQKVNWEMTRATDKGKRILRAIGLDTETLCPKPNGQFSYFKDCRKYLNCWRGRPHLQTCPPQLLFNSATGTCDWPPRVVCPSARVVIGGESPFVVVAPPSGQRVRLRGGTVPWTGYVQVWKAASRGREGGWGHVTAKSGRWGRKEGDVVCKQLGFLRGSSTVSQGRVFGLVPGDLIALRDPQCNGTETDLRSCPQSKEDGDKEHDLSTAVAGLRCIPNSASECGPGGVRWGVKCYHTVTERPGPRQLWGSQSLPPLLLDHSQAKQFCQDRSMRLVTIMSQVENDFVSELLSVSAHDTAGYHTAGVRTSLLGDTLWLWQNSGRPPSATLEPFVKWWPGWNTTASASSVYSRRGADARSSGSTLCVVLRETFPSRPLPATEDDVHADYYWWELSDCDERLGAVCETDPRDIGCIVGLGDSYIGSANTTTSGASCNPPPTPSSSAPSPLINPRRRGKADAPSLAAAASLAAVDTEAAYCRNPDGEDGPWCYVQAGTTERCDIPRCEEQTINVSPASKCEAGRFRCSESGSCVYGEWRCDGHVDCPAGEDEQSCLDYSHEFAAPLRNRRLRGREVEKWLYTPHQACATRCASARSMLCKAFNYQPANETCVLCDGVAGEAGGLDEQPGWEYYERAAYTLPANTCSNTCLDGRCYTDQQSCDGRRDCRSGEDEMSCDGSEDFLVRLSNGTGPHEGRVEVRVLGRWGGVCDDLWDLPDGDVVCRQLGYPLGAREVHSGGRFGGVAGTEAGVLLMDDVNCGGNEAGLQDCDFAGWGEHDCTLQEVASVTCGRPGDQCLAGTEHQCANGRCVLHTLLCDGINDCYDGSDEEEALCKSPLVVRLAGQRGYGLSQLKGTDGEPLEGRVEVRFKGVWGTVCDDDFGIEEGHVVCRAIGLRGATAIFKNGTFGPGTGKIWLDDLRCLGHEETLEVCSHRGWGLSNCDHSEDVGVRCSPKGEGGEVTGTAHEVSGGGSLSPPPAPSPLEGLLPENCGTRSVEDRPISLTESARVVGGYSPRPGAHPWMVGVRVRTTTGSSHWCGGAVLSEDYVLTAAHCLTYRASTYIVRVGDYDNEEEEPLEKDFLVERTVKHHQFDKGPFYNNDIAIIKVKRKNGQGISFSERVQPLCLVPHEFEYPAGLNCTVAGWGAVGHDMGFSRMLLSTNLPIIPRSVCRSDRVFGPTRLSEGMFCAGHLEGGIDTCQGDSGGPLVCYINGRFSVVGITSWGHGCARPNKPGVYTRLTDYLHWLYTVLAPDRI